MTSIQYIDGRGTEHALEIDPDASEAAFLMVYGAIVDLDRLTELQGQPASSIADMKRLATIESQSQVACGVCQLIPDIPEHICYWKSPHEFRTPRLELILKVITSMTEAFGGLAEVLSMISKPEPTQEQKRQQELDEQIKVLLAERAQLVTV